MALTVRLDPSLDSAFTRICKQRGITKTAVITAAVRKFVQRDLVHDLSFAELAADLFGADASPLPKGVADVSGNVKALLKQKLRAKHTRSHRPAGCAAAQERPSSARNGALDRREHASPVVDLARRD